MNLRTLSLVLLLSGCAVTAEVGPLPSNLIDCPFGQCYMQINGYPPPCVEIKDGNLVPCAKIPLQAPIAPQG